MAGPRVTVGLAVYNGEEFLEEALRSLVEQDFQDLEILIADNASTDGTAAICARMAAEHPRIRILRSDVNRGLGWNHNRTLPEARVSTSGGPPTTTGTARPTSRRASRCWISTPMSCCARRTPSTSTPTVCS